MIASCITTIMLKIYNSQLSILFSKREVRIIQPSSFIFMKQLSCNLYIYEKGFIATTTNHAILMRIVDMSTISLLHISYLYSENILK